MIQALLAVPVLAIAARRIAASWKRWRRRAGVPLGSRTRCDCGERLAYAAPGRHDDVRHALLHLEVLELYVRDVDGEAVRKVNDHQAKGVVSTDRLSHHRGFLVRWAPLG